MIAEKSSFHVKEPRLVPLVTSTSRSQNGKFNLLNKSGNSLIVYAPPEKELENITTLETRRTIYELERAF